ncbi:glucose-6-phosphate isomerase [Sphingosinicellaceae bacterium]|nr:glucose-6-phosphate isomerase [Sphingosinicellaceae bacterium]
MTAELWSRLGVARDRLANASLPALFESEPDRVAKMSVDVAGLHLDFSKLALDAAVVADLAALAEASGLADLRARLFAGEVVNPSENRAATHPHERGSGSGPALAVAAEGKAAMRAVVERLRGDGTRHILHIGIGGSALGPALLVDALGHGGDGPTIEIVANIDGVALERAAARCDPATTRIIVVSKTFTTQETMTNAASALDWLAAAGIAEPRSKVVAVTAAPDKARAWGAADVLPFAETVGGRYSLWSAVGLPLALRCGWSAFEELLAGAAAIDRHFADAPFERNAPALAGAFDVWAASVLGQGARGVFAYDERLRLLPSFLQQLEMESNGKRVARDGRPLDRRTAPVTWGGTGTDAQHAVFQLLHQGSLSGPVEFVAVKEPGHALGGDHHAQLLSNCFAQGAALMRGRTHEEALAKSGGNPALAAAKTFPGNRPSTTILLDRLDARTLGSLLAFYEHRTFTAACLLGINPFDQWGVELGKEMANAMGEGGEFDASTTALMRRAGL